MRRNRWFRIAAIVAIGCFAAGVAVASGGAEETSGAARVTSAPGPFGAYDPVIEVHSVRELPSVAEYRPGDDIHDNVWTRAVEEKLGIRVVYDWIAESGQWINRVNLMLTAGDIPDYFSAPSSIFAQLVDAQQLGDLMDAYENYASPDLKAGQDAFPEGFEAGIVDGQLLGLSPGFYGWLGMGSVVWIRSDWMEKYGLEPPATMDDLVEIMETFAAGESTGARSAYGVALNRDFYGVSATIKPIANAFHAYPTSWIRKDDGSIVYGSIQPEMKEVLAILADWYARGLIDQEFGVKDINAAHADLVSGRVGVNFGLQWLGWYPFDQLLHDDPNAVFLPYAIPSGDGDPVSVQVDWPIYNYWVVNDDFAYPEAMIKMANLYNKYQFHGTDEEFKNFSDGGEYAVQRQLSPIEIIDPRQEMEIYRMVSHALETGDESDLTVPAQAFYENAKLWRDEQDPSGFGRFIQMGPYGSYRALEDQVNNDQVVITALRGPDPAEWSRNRSVLDALEADTFTKIIIGDQPIDSFDAFVADWLSLGGADATEAINEVYGR